MFTTIAEGVNAYENELKQYAEWSNELKKKHGIKDMEDLMLKLEDNDLLEMKKRSAKLDGMAQALGFTTEEVETIEKKFGFEV
jgi:hypothetical protein